VSIIKIHLLLPPHTFIERYDEKISKAAGSVPPLGLLYIASVLNKNGFKVSVSDGSKESYDDILKKLYREKPEIVGISVMTFLWNRTKQMIDEIKKMLPKTFIVVGGSHPTVFKKKCLIESPLLDAVVVGEGEYTMLDLAKNLEKRSFGGIKGLIYRRKNKIFENPPRPFIKNLDSIPFPARNLINIFDYVPAPEEYKNLPMTTMISSRGCPFRCIFCSRLAGSYVRLRSPKNLIYEIKELVEDYKIKEIQFHDDTFTINRERIINFSKLIKEEKLDIRWSVNSRVDTVDKKLLRIMKDAGCWKIFFGIESLSQKNLNILKKGVIRSQIFNAIKWSREVGIETEASFMFGTPGDGFADGLKMIETIKKLNVDYALFFLLTPFPGTELYDNVKKHGNLVSNNFDDFTTHKAVFVPYGLTEKELEKLVPIAYKKFYIRSNYILRSVLKIRSLEDIRRYSKALKFLLSISH
jgi:anaerobic magnesium-protoporphyrin IX monomethyl ester cyclase